MSCGCIGNYHEPNVDWLIAEIKKALADWDKTETNWEEMKKWIQDYFANLDITADVNAKLDEMAKDGTLESIINDEIFSNLNNRVTQNTSDIAAANTRIDNINKELDNGYAIIIGDSYAVGDSSGGQNTSWAYLLGEKLKSNGIYDNYVLLAANGAAFNITGPNKFLTMLQNYVSSPMYPLSECKAIILGTAGNDAWNLSGLPAACDDFYNYVTTTFTNAKLSVAFIGWTYATNNWNNFKSAYIDISNAFSNNGSFLPGPEQVMHYYPFFAAGDSSHPTAIGQKNLCGAVYNSLLQGSFSFTKSAIFNITAPNNQSITGNIIGITNGNHVFIQLVNLQMNFSSGVEIACSNTSAAKLGDLHLEDCIMISDGTHNLAIKTPAILKTGENSFVFAMASINIVAAEILLSFTKDGFDTVTNVTNIQFLDTTACFDRMIC